MRASSALSFILLAASAHLLIVAASEDELNLVSVEDSPASTTAASSSSTIGNTQQQQSELQRAPLTTSCAADHHRLCNAATREGCVQALRRDWFNLESTCRRALSLRFPCMQEAAENCEATANGLSLLSCLTSLHPRGMSSQCVTWVQEHRANWQEGWTGSASTAESTFWNDDGSFLSGNDDDNNNSNTGSSDVMWRRQDFPSASSMFFVLFAVAILAGATGSCCTLCCVRRARGCNNCNAYSTTSIPIHQMPQQRGARYAVMMDDLAVAAPTSAV